MLRRGTLAAATALSLIVTVTAAPPAPAAPGSTATSDPTVRADGSDVRFRDPGVTGATRRVEGDLVEVSHGQQRYFVETPTGRAVPVDFGGVELPSRARGAQVEAEATPAGDVRSATISPSPRAASVTPSAHRAYVALVSNKGAFGSSNASILATIDVAMSRWREESNGAISSFTRVDVKSLATTTDCSSGSALYNEAARTLYPGVSTSSTSGNHIITISPPSCDAGGVGTVQAGISSGGRLNAGWDPDSTLQTLMHEFGHNFSLDHANACFAPVGPSCVTEEYANTYALMGYTLSNTPAYTPAALDSFERSRLGITDPGEVASVTLGAGQRTATSTYDLRARGTTAGLRGLRLTDPTTATVYSVDWRSGGGRDARSDYALNPGRNNAGVTVERLAADAESAAVLGHPNSAAGGPVQFGLAAGRTFTAGGTTITVASIGNSADPNATTRVGVTLTDPSVAPDTTITSGPAAGATVTTNAVDLAFAGVPADATAGFDCKLDAGAWAACSSPTRLSALADGSHTFQVRARDAAGRVDATPATRTFTANTVLTLAPGARVPARPGTSAAALAGALEPAKLEVTRATVSPSTRRLSIVAPITARASGTVRVALRAAGRTTSFNAPIDARQRRVRVNRRLSAAQARSATGILTITYRGDSDTQPQTVRMRAASRSADLRAGRPILTGSRLAASGKITARGRGIVRVQLLFEPSTGPTRTLTYTAKIAGGRYRLTTTLPADVRAAIDGRRGVLHSYTLFTGDIDRRIRGELASYQVLAPR